jgi:hypothetical protein
MKNLKLMCAALVAAVMLTPAASFAQATKKAKDTTADATTAKTKVAANTPSATEIADAKSKGMVWVNTDSKIYHKDGEFYGKTKKGQFMTEADAQKAGYRAAKTSAVKTAKTEKKKS